MDILQMVHHGLSKMVRVVCCVGIYSVLLYSRHRVLRFTFTAGLFCCTLYHFFVHDIDGPIGAFLRRIVPEWCMGGLDDATFGCVCVGVWMQVCGLLQMPFLLGPSFSPFHALMKLFGKVLQLLPKAEVNLVPEGAPIAAKVESNGAVLINDGPSAPPQARRKRRSRNKKKEL